MFWTLFLGAVKLILLWVVIIYAVQILIALRTEGAHDHLNLDRHDLAHSIERLLVWLGAWVLTSILAVLRASLNVLEDTSADIGEWVLHR